MPDDHSANQNVVQGKNRFQESELFRNTSILISGTTFAQLIPIILQPILRRYYSPEDFGAYAVYSSFVGILLVAASFRYELTIVLPRRDSDAVNILFLSMILNFFFNILLFVFILIFKNSIVQFVNLSPDHIWYLYVIPLGTLFYSSSQSINYWLIRKKRFVPSTINKFLRRGSEGTVQVTSELLNLQNGLIFGDLTGQFSNFVSGIYYSKKSGVSPRLFSFKKMKTLLGEYSVYPKYNLITALMSACSFFLPAIMITKFYSADYTGYFDLSRTLLSLPLALIATSLSGVLLQRISEKNRMRQSIRKDLIDTSFFVFLIMIIEVVVIMLWSEEIFKLFFGSDWIYSGTISRVLVWAFSLNFFVASFNCIFVSLGKIKLWSIWQIFYFFSILSLFYFKFLPFNSFIRIYTAIEVFCSILITILMILIFINYEKCLSGGNEN